MAKINWIKDASTTLVYAGEDAANKDKIYDGDFNTSNGVFGAGAASFNYSGLLTATFSTKKYLDEILFKIYATSNYVPPGGSCGATIRIRIYSNAVWTEVYLLQGRTIGGSQVLLTGPWADVEKVEAYVNAHGSSVYGAHAGFNMYEVQAFGTLQVYGMVA